MELVVKGPIGVNMVDNTGVVSVALVRLFFNFRVSNIRVSNRTLIYNVCPEAALT